MQREERLTFKKAERLCSRTEIDRLFSGGRSINVSPLRLVFISRDDTPEIPAKTMFVVPRKAFRKAHDRNRLRRRIREAFRHHKTSLYQLLLAKNKCVSMAILYNAREPAEYDVIEKATVRLIGKLREVF